MLLFILGGLLLIAPVLGGTLAHRGYLRVAAKVTPWLSLEVESDRRPEPPSGDPWTP